MPKNLIPVQYKNERILTTEQLAQIYETDANNIKNNFNNHKNNFKEGKHYFYLEGEELKKFKNCVNNIDLVDKHTRNLYLWTEHGANRHCKMLDTDKAWEQFDNLEETYFRVKENFKALVSNTTIEEIKLDGEALKLAVDILKPSQASKVKMLTQFNQSKGLSTVYLPVYTDEQEGHSATELLKKYNVGFSALKFNKLMIENSFLEDCIRKSTNKDGIKHYKKLTEKGLKYGKNVVSARGTEKETQPLYYEDKFQELISLLN